MSHRGYLKKKSGGVLGNFQSRFCVLDNNALSYFKTDASPSPQGVVSRATACQQPSSCEAASECM